jgi:putative transposase
MPNLRNAIKQAYCPKRFYRHRHKIENFFCRIKDWRRIATRYDNWLKISLLPQPSSAH